MRFFKLKEFDSPDLKGSGKLMDETFLAMLEDARNIANIPFKINSGFRTIEHNKEAKGKSNSSHLRGLAADIYCVDSRSRFTIVSALQQAGFNRIGISKSFIHCDIDTNKSKNVIWIY